MADPITYQEIASTIASILARHPQFEKIFMGFEKLAWKPTPRGLIKRNDNGAAMIVERDKVTGRLDIIFRADVEIEEE